MSAAKVTGRPNPLLRFLFNIAIKSGIGKSSAFWTVVWRKLRVSGILSVRISRYRGVWGDSIFVLGGGGGVAAAVTLPAPRLTAATISDNSNPRVSTRLIILFILFSPLPIRSMFHVPTHLRRWRNSIYPYESRMGTILLFR